VLNYIANFMDLPAVWPKPVPSGTRCPPSPRSKLYFLIDSAPIRNACNPIALNKFFVSNRRKKGNSCAILPCESLATSHSPLATSSNRYIKRLKIAASPSASTTSRNLIDTLSPAARRRAFHPDTHHPKPVTLLSPAKWSLEFGFLLSYFFSMKDCDTPFLIDTRPIRIAHNPFAFRGNLLSNRHKTGSFS
jgi:hypothetical protein